MDLSLFQLLLVTVLPTSSAYEYRLITNVKSWTDAQAYCREHYVDLATVENDLDLGRIQREAQRLGFTSEAWVGLYNDVNSWRCSRGEVPLGSWSKWEHDQPNNRFGKDECVTIQQDGTWFDFPCLTQTFFICYDETISSTDKFVFYSNEKSFKEAQDYCRQKHTDLACPTNDNENTMIKSKLYYGWSWIGFYREAWKWSDKSNNSDIKWLSDKPDNTGGNDNCGYVDQSVFGGGGTSAGWFDDGDCLNQRAFFCQYVPKRKQVVRVVVQSGQDVNDPAVKAALLEKIQQTLKEQGLMENATLRWKEQSDGTVFYKQKEKKSENMENNTVTTCEL
uniref:Si:dkey-187j14.6 n=1 Tax=Astyanax mexicanus TaxID=7994 RepID=W5LQP0_ASTMX